MALRLLGICVGLAALAGGIAADGGASDLIDRNASNVKLDVNTKGEALLTYKVGGKIRRVLAWGAVDALPPTQSREQVRFRLDYSGGSGQYRRTYWEGFRNTCGAYRGPALGWLVKACTAPDGSHWALQSWQRALPNYGLDATPTQAVWELRLSHWRGEPANLEVKLDWAYRRFDHLYGRLTYRGTAVHGFRSTSTGVPLDTFGRNFYVRHLRFGLRRGLEAGEQLPRPERRGHVLLRLLRARCASVGQGRALPRHGDRPGRHPRSALGVGRARALRPRARPDRERGSTRALRGRFLQAELSLKPPAEAGRFA